MASAEHEPIMGVWGPELLFRDQGAKPPEAEHFSLCCGMPEMEHSCYDYELFYGQ